jgi:hypothetical protein
VFAKCFDYSLADLRKIVWVSLKIGNGLVSITSGIMDRRL